MTLTYRLYEFGRSLPNLDELKRDGHSDYYQRISSRARGLWSLKNKTSETFVFYILGFQRKFTNWTTMLLERPKDEVALLSVFLLLRIPLFEPVSFEIVPGEYANRLASTYRSNSTCRSSHGNRQGRAFLCFALRRATCPATFVKFNASNAFPGDKDARSIVDPWSQLCPERTSGGAGLVFTYVRHGKSALMFYFYTFDFFFSLEIVTTRRSRVTRISDSRIFAQRIWQPEILVYVDLWL